MTIIVGTNNQLLHMLGITQKYVIEADIRLRGDEIATVTLTCAADVDSDQLTTARFMLQALDPEPAAAPTAPPLDLDAMCAAAQQRLATAVNHSADWTLAEWRTESDAIHVRMNRAIRIHKVAATSALCLLEPMGQLAYDLANAKAEALDLLIDANEAIEGLRDLRSALGEIHTRQYMGGL